MTSIQKEAGLSPQSKGRKVTNKVEGSTRSTRANTRRGTGLKISNPCSTKL